MTVVSILKQLVRPAYHRLYRSAIRLRCQYEDRRTRDVSIPPAFLRFRVSESFSEDEFASIGRGCARLIEERLCERGGIADRGRVLDFGCGCGRTIRWTIEAHPEAQFYGSDVDPDAIDWCRTHLQKGVFQTNSAFPPLNYPAQYFDVVYCISVFTHLNEEMQDAWLSELRRILKPDGVIILTVHGENAARQLSEADRQVLRSRGFFHRTSRKLSGFLPDWYHTTWHSRDYILSKVETLFANAAYVEVPDGIQDCVTGGVPLLPSPSMELGT